ncbi:S8 family serine peptidase [[Pseudomonas] boreopolis]|uniref:Serine protease n=1 Tax=Xanthomonas boreopolis TaxID=86183 RepID=A0A919F734_9XANT|nr:serine protease [[Pseudomonas] boreopolis]
MNEVRAARTLLASALALALVGCGGGGGGGSVRPEPPPASPPPAPPPTTPPPTTPPPSTPQPAVDAHLALTDTRPAHDLGYTGAGYRIGVVDTGVNRNHPALQGRVVANYTYVDPSANNLRVDDVVGHGTTVAQLAAGAPVGNWPGGIAPGAQIVSARIINDKEPEDDGSGEGNEVNGALGLQAVHDDLVAAGVRIMNNSWAGLYWTNPSATAPIANEYRNFIFANDGLVVFAAGNDGRSDPSDMAALPSQPGPNGTRPAADLERGWLAVAALDTANPSRLADYSNACGVAMRYCLVAPGTSMFTGHDDTAGSISYWYGSGTSFAAPLVSGAAALVWQAFPYFNNDLVRQTLLGTATDLGAPGVDPVFGYGLLDVGRAVLGPAKFDWGDVSVSFDGTSTWSNPISGGGGLVKRGTGTLVLASTLNTFEGRTQVLEGTLQSASLGGAASIANGATLSASYRIGGSVDNAGTLQLGEGTLGVSGNYVQAADARLALNVGDWLHASGSASIAGELQVLGKRGYVSLNTAYTVLRADAGLSGTFARLTWGPGVFVGQGTLAYDANTAYITLQRLDVATAAAALPGITAASLASATRVEQAFRQIDAQQQGAAPVAGDFVRSAAALQQSADAKQALASLQSLSGQAHAEAMTATFDAVDLGRRALSQHFGAVAWSGGTRGGTWRQALGGTGQGSFAGIGGALAGWMVGHDFMQGDGGVAGFAFGEARMSDATLPSSRDRNRQVQAQAYWGRRGDHLYALGQVGSGQVHRQIARELQFGQARAETSVDYGARFFSASLEAGYRWQRAGLVLAPYLGADHVRIDSDGFSEQGGEGFGLRADADTADRTQVLAGLRGEYRWRGLALGAYAEWQQALASNGLSRQVGFVGADAWGTLADLQPGRSGGLFGFSVQAPLGRLGALGLGYDQRFGARGEDRAFGLRYLLGF